MLQLDKNDLKNTYSFEAYMKLLKELVEQGQTTGTDQSELLINFTKLNLARLKRIVKTTTIQPNLKAKLERISEPQIWLTITEGWCGDAAQSVGAIDVFAKSNPNITHQLVLRDEHPALIDQFLTNGGRAIPKVIILNNNYEVLGHWGPRPQILQDLVLEWKQQPNFNKEVLGEQLHQWYTENKTQALQDSFLEVLDTIL